MDWLKITLCSQVSNMFILRTAGDTMPKLKPPPIGPDPTNVRRKKWDLPVGTHNSKFTGVEGRYIQLVECSWWIAGGYKPTNITINVGNPNLHPSIDDFTTFFFRRCSIFFNKHVTLWAPGQQQARVRPLWWHSQCLGRVQVTRWTVRLSRCFQLQKMGLKQHIHFCLEDVALWFFNLAMANHTFLR